MLCAKKIIHSCEKLFRGRGGQDFVLEIVVFSGCNEARDFCFFSEKELFVDG